jgi:hypothetical protein
MAFGSGQAFNLTSANTNIGGGRPDRSDGWHINISLQMGLDFERNGSVAFQPSLCGLGAMRLGGTKDFSWQSASLCGRWSTADWVGMDAAYTWGVPWIYAG